MPTYFRLQDLTTVTATGAQRIEEAIEVGAYKTLVVQCRKPVAGTGVTLSLQHAAVLDEDAFTDISSPTFDLASTGNEIQTFTDCLRYVRWNVSAYSSGSPQFLLDVVAREA